MHGIGKKMIEISVTDGGVGVPDTGFLDLVLPTNDNSQFLALLGVASIVVCLVIVSIFFALRRHKHAQKIAQITSVGAIIGMLMLPLPAQAINPKFVALDNDPIQITIDKSQSLSASAATDVTLANNASDYAQVYAVLESDFNGQLGDGITVSAVHDVAGAKPFEINTSDTLIYTTPGPVVAPTDVGFNVTVTVTDDLPVGDYYSEVNFYGLYTQVEEFKFTVDTTKWETSLYFILPINSYVGGTATGHAFNWLVNCDSINNPSNFYALTNDSGDQTCNYASPGEYQITIRPNGAATMGWMDAFGFGAYRAWSYPQLGGYWYDYSGESHKLKTIDTPLTNKMRTYGSSYRYAGMFAGTMELERIPSDLFAYINTAGSIDMSFMFDSTFGMYGDSGSCFGCKNEPIPSGLFDMVDTSSATNLAGMFKGAFYGYADFTDAVSIPENLFGALDTSKATNFAEMFNGTFSGYGMESSVASIPPRLFAAINTSRGTDLSYMFANTFRYSGSEGIPRELFASLDTSSAENMAGMFYQTFAHYVVSYFNSSSHDISIPDGLFALIDTSNAKDLSYMFAYTFDNFAIDSTVATIPEGLFDGVDTSSATNLESMFRSTFWYFGTGWDTGSTIATIPSGLFKGVDTSGVTNLSNIFCYTFSNYGGANTLGDSTPDTDINDVWIGADLSGITAGIISTPSTYDGALYGTFSQMSSLTGSAQTFINDKLGGTNPTDRAWTFAGTGVTDLASLHANWK